MDNKISFTGFKNVGVFQTLLLDAERNPQTVNTNLLIQLTDDFNGKDLEKFYQLTKKCKPIINIPKFEQDKKFIYLSTLNNIGKLPKIFINGEKLPSKDEALPLYTYLANLTKRIMASAKKEEIKINKDFKYGDDAKLYLCSDTEVAKTVPNELLEAMFDQNNIGEAAEIINDSIAMRMEDYFA